MVMLTEGIQVDGMEPDAVMAAKISLSIQVILLH